MCTTGNMIQHPNADDEAELVEEKKKSVTNKQSRAAADNRS